MVANIKKPHQILANTTNKTEPLDLHENNMNAHKRTLDDYTSTLRFFFKNFNKNHLLLNMSSYTAVMA